MMTRYFLYRIWMACLTPLLQAAEPPSTVTAPVKEADLPTLHLTPEAVQRLGLSFAEVTRETIAFTLSYPGIVRWPAGDAADALAPAPLGSPEELRLLAERQATADGAVRLAQATWEAATQARQRAGALAEAKAGSARVLEETTSAVLLAKASLDTAIQHRALLGQPVADIAASPTRWISVAIPGPELARVKTAGETTIKIPGQPSAKPVGVMPAARQGTAMPGGAVEIYFTVTDASLSLGQTLEVTMTMGGKAAESLALPWSAVVYDATGGAWVYVVISPGSFSRRRVSLSRVAGDAAVLAAGPPAGTKVVVKGVAELFGAEFGGFK